jgi:hypothetical protein
MVGACSCHDLNRLFSSLMWSLGLFHRWLELSICVLAVSSWGGEKIWREPTDCVISMLYMYCRTVPASRSITFFQFRSVAKFLFVQIKSLNIGFELTVWRVMSSVFLIINVFHLLMIISPENMWLWCQWLHHPPKWQVLSDTRFHLNGQCLLT